MLHFGMGFSPTKKIYVDSYHFVDLQDGFDKIHIQEAHSIWKNSKMANGLNTIVNLVY